MAKKKASFVWSPGNVSAKNIVAMAQRSYIEQKALRELMEHYGPFEAAAEVGAGFGRMTAVVADHAGYAVAFERELALAAAGKRWLPKANFVQVPNLTSLPARDSEFDFVMTFTVLQHMSDADVATVISEIKRISRKYVLLVEDTNSEYHYKDKGSPHHFTHGRTAYTYQLMMSGFDFIYAADREVEPTYKGHSPAFVGQYMLFERPAAA